MFGFVLELGDVAEAILQAVGDLAPAGRGLVAVFLGEGGLHHGVDHRLLALLSRAQEDCSGSEDGNVATPRPGDLGGGGLEALRGVADHKLHTALGVRGEGMSGIVDAVMMSID